VWKLPDGIRDFPDAGRETANAVREFPNTSRDDPDVSREAANALREVPDISREPREYFSTRGEKMPKDYVPQNDTQFQAWLTNFVTVLNANLATVGLVAADVTPLTTAQTNFNTAVTTQITAQDAAAAAVATKKTRRITLETTLRPLVRRINNHPGMTDGLRANLAITVPDRVPSRRGVGVEIPGIVLDLRPGQVVIHFGSDAGNELRNGKPAWALGCNIYRKRGTETDYSLIAFDTASPYIDTVTGSAVNVSYKAAYRGVRATDIGGSSAEQTIAAGS